MTEKRQGPTTGDCLREVSVLWRCSSTESWRYNHPHPTLSLSSSLPVELNWYLWQETSFYLLIVYNSMLTKLVVTTQALDCEQSLIFLCKVTAPKTHARERRKDLREKADCRQSTNLTPMILKLRIKQGKKFGTLKKPMFRLFDVIIFDK